MELDYRSSCGDVPTDPADGDLCGHTPEDYAEAALKLEPKGFLWCKDFTTIKAATYRAFGKLLSDFEQRICDLFKESLACESVELLEQWEKEYGLPYPCSTGFYPTDIAQRQALVCLARRGNNLVSMAELEDILRTTLNCPELTITKKLDEPKGICISGITNTDADTCNIIQHATVGGWTGGVGKSLQYAKSPEWELLLCILNRYLPSHIYWVVCPEV